MPDAVRVSTPPRRIVARLSRAELVAAGATAAAITASGCGDTMSTADYGAPGLPFDGDASLVIADASVADVAETGDAMHDAADATDASAVTTDANEGGSPPDAASDADD
jgi:hypothetical protein